MGLSELVRENGALDAYVEAQDQQRAVQLSLSVLSTLDFLQESNNTDVSKLRFQKYWSPIIYNMYIFLVLVFSFITSFPAKGVSLQAKPFVMSKIRQLSLVRKI